MKHSEETKKKIGDANRGENNGRWIDGRKQIEYPREWTKALRDKIRGRQKKKCGLCGEKVEGSIQVHHIDGNKLNCKAYNLVAICNTCHGIVHRVDTVEEYKAKLYAYTTERDAPYKLPT